MRKTYQELWDTRDEWVLNPGRLREEDEGRAAVFVLCCLRQYMWQAKTNPQPVLDLQVAIATCEAHEDRTADLAGIPDMQSAKILSIMDTPELAQWMDTASHEQALDLMTRFLRLSPEAAAAAKRMQSHCGRVQGDCRRSPRRRRGIG